MATRIEEEVVDYLKHNKCATKFADIAQWRTQVNIEESIFTMKDLKIRYTRDQERFGKSVSAETSIPTNRHLETNTFEKWIISFKRDRCIHTRKTITGGSISCTI